MSERRENPVRRPGAMWVDENGYVRAEQRSPSLLERVANAAPTLILLMVVVIGGVVALNQSQDQSRSDEIARIAAEDARESEIQIFENRLKSREACVQSGNELRKDIRREFKTLKTKVFLPYYESLVPVAPPGTLGPIEAVIRKIHRRVSYLPKRFPLVNCEMRYPLLDDPRTAFDEELENRTPHRHD